MRVFGQTIALGSAGTTANRLLLIARRLQRGIAERSTTLTVLTLLSARGKRLAVGAPDDQTTKISNGTTNVNLARRFWPAALIIFMVAIHGLVIAYVRSRVATLNTVKSSAVEIGNFRFQPVADKSKVFHFRLHAVMDPSRRYQGEERLNLMKMEIREKSEQVLRTFPVQPLSDPKQVEVREKLMKVVWEFMDEPLVQRVLITDWLEVPVESVGLQVDGPTETEPKGSKK